jgi:dihydrofolate reductase
MAMNVTASVFVAVSLDGFIARQDGSIDWLNQASALFPDGEDGGYREFIRSIDVVVMGRHTYEQVLTFGAWPYGDLPVVVLSSRPVDIPASLAGAVTSSWEAPGEVVERLAGQGAKHLYIDGGITIQRFLAAGLIDEITVTVIPVLLGEGRPLFGPTGRDVPLTLVEMRRLGPGFVQVRYRVDNSP